jgi:hypothetical protein
MALLGSDPRSFERCEGSGNGSTIIEKALEFALNRPIGEDDSYQDVSGGLVCDLNTRQ